MNQPEQDFIDTLILAIDDAEQEDVSYDAMLEHLQEAIKDVMERKTEREAKDKR